MSGTFDDIIRQAMMEEAAKKTPQVPVRQPTQADSDRAMRSVSPGPYGSDFYRTTEFDPPDLSRGAIVPRDSVKDYGYVFEDKPNTGGFVTPPQLSVQEQEDKVRRAAMDKLMDQISERIAQPKFDINAVGAMQKQVDALGAASPSWQKANRIVERQKNAPLDADVMMKAIEARQAQGRGR